MEHRFHLKKNTFIITGATATVSTLATVVGQPKTPAKNIMHKDKP